MAENKNFTIGITQGDLNGIGYEVIIKSLSDNRIMELCTPVVYGLAKVASYHKKYMDLPDFSFQYTKTAEQLSNKRPNLINLYEEEVKVDLGTSTRIAGQMAERALYAAGRDLKNNLIDAIVTAPVNKNNIQSEKFKFPGHTSFFEHYFGGKEHPALMMMVAEKLRIGFATNYLPIKDVAANITADKLVEKCRLLHTSLKRDFRINNPRIAVLALNPQPGAEEENIITPALKTIEESGIQVYGPFTADDFFGNGLHYGFDAILAMYDDQGNVPFKTLATEFGVKMKAGFPFVITTPDQDPSFDIAGKGKADPASLRHAIYAAIDIFRNRIHYDEPLANPLPKLYHEKREDGEKARFAIKAKDQFKHEDPAPKEDN